MACRPLSCICSIVEDAGMFNFFWRFFSVLMGSIVVVSQLEEGCKTSAFYHCDKNVTRVCRDRSEFNWYYCSQYLNGCGSRPCIEQRTKIVTVNKLRVMVKNS